MFENWEELKENCLNCRKCSLCEVRSNVVFGVGNPCAKVMFIGEGPGRNEDLQGEPFVGAGGQLLDKYLAAVDLDRRTNIYIANIVKCRPPQNRDPGDGVITMPPVYYPFRMTIEHNNRKNVECPLINTNETYTIDFDLFEKLCAEEKNKMFIFCNPHNPVGRVWTEDEIAKLGAICAKHNVIVVSDEIHSDLIMPGHKHVAFANACKDALPKYLVCTAPSKTFNLATLQTSNIVIPDEELRTKFQSILQQHFTPSAGALGLEACRLGYTECEGWLAEVIDLIYKNYKNFCKFIDVNCPGVTYSDLQGTYLMWIDCTTFAHSSALSG